MDAFDPTIGALNTALNLRQLNHNVITSNIANADTPGYKAKAVDFESSLRDALGVGDGVAADIKRAAHRAHQETDPVEPVVFEESNGVESLDGNTVDRANEMAKLAENQLLYDTAVELLKRKLGMVKYGISEGGGNR